MNAKNRIPWIVAAAALLFAMIVLVRNEIKPSAESRYTGEVPQSQAMIQPVDGGNTWRPTRTPAVTPLAGDFSPWTQKTPAPDAPGHDALPATPVPTVTPTPVPTPKPLNVFRGIIIDDEGQAVVRAHVRIISGGRNTAAERSAITDAEGRFKIADIPDEKLDKVIVEARGYSVAVMEDIPLPLPDELQIGMSPLAGIDALVLDFSTTSSEPIMFTGTMQASLLQLKGADDVSTNALGISEPVLPVDTYLPVRNQDVTVTDGVLQFDNVETGKYRLAIKTGNKVAESDTLEVKDGARTSTTLVLGMKHTVKGNVVGGDTAKPVEQARVSLSPARQPGASPEFPDYLSFTDGDGEFVLPEVQPGRYWMVVGAAGYTTKTLEHFEVLPGIGPEPTSVTLEKQSPLITVYVINGEGRPMAQAPLVLMAINAPKAKMYFGKSDEAGLYRFDNLLPGRYNLSVTAPGDRTRQKTLTVELGEGEVKEVLLSFGNSVVVSGKALTQGKAYKGLISFVLRGAAMADNLVTTNESGEFSVDLEPGEYMVGTPLKPASEMITVTDKPAQSIRLDFK